MCLSAAVSALLYRAPIRSLPQVVEKIGDKGVHLGQDDVGRRHLEVALRENPNFDEARQLLAALNQPGGPAGRGTLAVQFSGE